MISSLSFLYLRSCAGDSASFLSLKLDVLVLQAAQPLVVVGDLVEGLEHLGLELGLDRGERERILHVVVVEVALARRLLAAFAVLAVAGWRGLERRRAGGRRRRRGGACGVQRGALRRRPVPAAASAPSPAAGSAGRRADGWPFCIGHVVLGVGAGIGRLEIDDVAQEHLAVVELVAPDDDGLEGQRAFAQARDHRLAAGLDALGDGDLALAGEQLDRAHFAQIHAHRIVGALGRLLLLGRGRAPWAWTSTSSPSLSSSSSASSVGLASSSSALLLLDDVDAHLVEHRVDVLDLVGGHLLGGQHGVELLVGDVAALLGVLDHLLDGGVGKIEQRQRAVRASPAVASFSFSGASLSLTLALVAVGTLGRHTLLLILLMDGRRLRAADGFAAAASQSTGLAGCRPDVPTGAVGFCLVAV